MPQTLQRRIEGATNWTTLTTNCLAWSYLDTNVSVGTGYEYLVGNKFIKSAIKAPPVENRGRLILLIDSTWTNQLAANLAQLKEDLVGDGWKVIRHDVARHNDTNWPANTNNIASIKSQVTNDYNAYSNEIKSILIIGHVPIPLSGNINPDGHGFRPWPTDTYYADVDGAWTDSNGDGIFNQNLVPSPLELAVGRVDFAKMPVFTNLTEDVLLNRYLEKSHRYRHKLLSFDQKVATCGLFLWQYDSSNSGTYYNAVRNGSAWYGLNLANLLDGNCFKHNKSFMWGLQAGSGTYTNIDADGANEHTSADLADSSKESATAFYMLHGSLFGEWNYQDNFLRATLGPTNSGLGAVWSALQTSTSISWQFQKLAFGAPIGSEWLLTMNDTNQFNPTNNPNIQFEWLGDPTLRMHIVAPPTTLSGRVEQSNVLLNWSPANVSNAQYFVYRSTNGLDGFYTRLTSSPTDQNSFIDVLPPSGPKMYQVRTLILTVTGSGSFSNLSQAAFRLVN